MKKLHRFIATLITIVMIIAMPFSGVAMEGQQAAAASETEADVPLSGVTVQYDFRRAAYEGDTMADGDARVAPFTDYTAARPWAYVADSMPEGPSEGPGGTLLGAFLQGNGMQIGRQAYGSLTEDWIALKIKVPAPGRYKAGLTYIGMGNNGIADIHIIALTSAAAIIADVESAITPETKIGTVDFFKWPDEGSVNTAAVGSFTLSENDMTDSGGECLLIFKTVGMCDWGTGCVLYPSLLELNGIGLSSAGLSVCRSEIGVGGIAVASVSPKLSTGDQASDGWVVKYTSSAPEIATVDEQTGKITGIKVGTAEITAEVTLDNITVSDKVVMTVTQSSSVTNLLPNPGMEQVSNNLPAEWGPWFYSPQKGSYSSDMEIKRSGDYSLRMDFPAEYVGTGGDSYRSKIIEIQPGVKYYASVYAYHKEGGSYIWLQFFDDSGSWAAIDQVGSDYNNKQNTWDKVTVERTAPPNATYACLTITLPGVTATTAYFDDAYIGPPPEDEPQVTTFPLAVDGHPRLFFTAADLPQMRLNATDTDHFYLGKTGKETWDGLEAKAREYLTENEFSIAYSPSTTVVYPLPPVEPAVREVPPEFTVNTFSYWINMSMQIQARMDTLSLAYAITGEADFANRAKSYLLALADWSRWQDPGYVCGDGGITCQDTAHIVLAVSFAYDLLYDVLSEQERVQVRTALETKGLAPLYEDLATFRDWNGHAFRSSALASGAAAIHGESANSNRYLTRVVEAYQWYFDRKLTSGQHEGPQYTGYSIDQMLRGLEHVSRTTGIMDLVNHPLLDDFLVRWATYFLAPGGAGVANFSDSTRVNLFIPTMMFINKWMDNGVAGWYLHESEYDIHEMYQMYPFLYYNKDYKVTPPSSWPNSAVLDEIGWAALRSGWGKSDMLLAFTSNDSKLGHNQYDQNSFQIATNNSWVAGDPGYPDFSPGPANDFSIRLGHSTIQVDGQGQSIKGNGVLTKGMIADDYAYVKGSAAGAYGNPRLSKFDRHIVQVDSEYYVMFDDLQSDTPHTYDWVLSNGNLSELKVDGNPGEFGQVQTGNRLTYSVGEALLQVNFIDENKLPITTSLYPGAEQYGYYTKVGSSASATAHQFLTLLKATPQPAGLYQAENLLPAHADSGKFTAMYNVVNTNMVFYAASEADDYITFEVQIGQPGDYELNTDFIKSFLYGQVQTYVDGQPIGGVYDGYNEVVQAAPRFAHGQLSLSAGTHTVTYKVVGKNPDSGNYFIGIDAIQIKPVKSEQETNDQAITGALLTGAGATGVNVSRGGESGAHDLVVFKKGSDAYAIGGVSSDADQAVINLGQAQQITGYHLTRGTRLSKDSRQLVQGSAPLNASVKIATGVNAGYDITGIVESDAANTITLHVPGILEQVRVDGQVLTAEQYAFNQTQGLLSLQLAGGVHAINVAAKPLTGPGTDPGTGPDTSGDGNGGGSTLNTQTEPTIPPASNGPERRPEPPVVAPEAPGNMTDTAGHWGKAAIDYVVSRGLFNGTSATTFSPGIGMTRAMVWTVLARLDGQNTTGGDTWYSLAQTWAKENGISDGFRPGDNVTREQFAAILHRYSGAPSVSCDLSDFTDAGQISNWALDAIQWAVQNGLIIGNNNKLNPQDIATRAEVAAILMRYIKLTRS